MPSPSLFTGTSRSLWMEQSKLLYIYIKSKEYEDKAHMKFIILRYIFQEKILYLSYILLLLYLSGLNNLRNILLY
jgi:hypothetical protein